MLRVAHRLGSSSNLGLGFSPLRAEAFRSRLRTPTMVSPVPVEHIQSRLLLLVMMMVTTI